MNETKSIVRNPFVIALMVLTGGGAFGGGSWLNRGSDDVSLNEIRDKLADLNTAVEVLKNEQHHNKEQLDDVKRKLDAIYEKIK